MSYYTLQTQWEGVREGAAKPQLCAIIVLVGCGGTGGFLAPAIARLLAGHTNVKSRAYHRLCLVDHDRVGPENLGRQNFSPADLDRFKSEVLAERIARDFGIAVDYSVLPYDHQMHHDVFQQRARLALIVGAVDNAAARRAIADTLRRGPVWWLDCGNGFSSGQVLLGNEPDAKALHQCFEAETGACYGLPAPNVQRPDLLGAPPLPATEDLNCAVAVERNEQSPTINQTMAALAATYVERLLNGTCGWMASYIDMENGTLQSVAAEPQNVARVIGKPAGSLMVRRRKEVA